MFHRKRTRRTLRENGNSIHLIFRGKGDMECQSKKNRSKYSKQKENEAEKLVTETKAVDKVVIVLSKRDGSDGRKPSDKLGSVTKARSKHQTCGGNLSWTTKCEVTTPHSSTVRDAM